MLPTNPEELAAILRLKLPSTSKVDTSSLRYVIYARKSTDEKEKQVHSTEDQVAVCMEYAEDKNLKVVDILEEKMTAKQAGVRPVFLSMLEKLKKGDYDGILAWHPDRLARNMKEAGEIIDLLDKEVIKDLQFKSFSFTNDTSGKMLLGITFVLSKEYTDKLSDDVTRGNRKSLERGSYVNKSKHGYVKDRNSRLIPDGNNFILLKKAFEMRIEKKTLEEIAEFLNKNNYCHSNTDVSAKIYGVTKQKLQTIMKDPVYTGILMYGKTDVVNLMDTQEFIPMIEVDDFMRINKFTNDKEFIKLSKQYKKGEDVKADLMRGMVICGGCEELTIPYINGKKLKNGSSGYFYYRCDTDGCTEKNKSTRAIEIITFASNYLATKPFSHEEGYEHFKKEMENVYKENMVLAKGQILTLSNQIATIEGTIEKTKNFLLGDESDTVKNFYRGDLERLAKQQADKTKEKQKLQKLMTEGKYVVPSYSEFIELLEKVSILLPKMRHIPDIDYIMSKIFLNFYVKEKKAYKLTLNKPFDSLSDNKVLNGAPPRDRTV